MNINNIFGAVLGFVMIAAMLYLFWTPIDNMLDSIETSDTELGVFLRVSFIALALVLGMIVPLNLATSDDRGEQ